MVYRREGRKRYRSRFSIEKNKLNIKYGINGTGKSTIALAIEKKDDLSFLKTFGSLEEPFVEFSENINKVVTFRKAKKEEI